MRSVLLTERRESIGPTTAKSPSVPVITVIGSAILAELDGWKPAY